MLKQIADVNLPTPWAHFRMLGFEAVDCSEAGTVSQDAVALLLGNVRSSPVLVRVHSQCTTGDIFHSLRCDCHDQLHLALRTIAREGIGVLIYEHQEGRGIGLMEKLRAYELQERGLDTIEANLELGHAADLRNYRLPAAIIRFLGISSIRLMTNNPDKIRAMLDAGIDVSERVSADVLATPFSLHYMATKRHKLGHFHDAIPSAEENTTCVSDQTTLTAAVDQM